ncbi:hypothetical protein PanWU01x14_112030, partial [Parasponia andersonii]
ISQDIVRTVQDIYKNWKNELSEHFKLNGGDENNLDLPHAHCSILPDLTQEIWNNSSAQSVPPRIDETLIADEVLSVRRGYRSGVSLKFKGAASTSSTAASPPWDPFVPDFELRDFFSQT